MKKENQITENFQMVYESVSKISNGEVSKISLYLHNYIFPKLTYRILEAKFPRLTTKSIELLENAIGTECITNMDNMMLQKSENGSRDENVKNDKALKRISLDTAVAETRAKARNSVFASSGTNILEGIIHFII